jgi:GDP-D-mannose dehydratase
VLLHEKSDYWVLATGVSYLVRKFLKAAFNAVNSEENILTATPKECGHV